MADPQMLININLNEKIVDGAELIYPTIEQHNCLQLRRWLKCHGRLTSGKKCELVER